MSSYKELYLKSQAAIADTIEDLEIVLEKLKNCMQNCEDEVISQENKVIEINNEL